MISDNRRKGSEISRSPQHEMIVLDRKRFAVGELDFDHIVIRYRRNGSGRRRRHLGVKKAVKGSNCLSASTGIVLIPY